VQLALYLRPGLDIGLALRGELFEAEENWSGAAKSFSAVSPHSPLAAFAAVSRARDLARLERFDEATALMRVSVKTDPNDVDALVALGDLYRAQEKWRDAAATYGRALNVTGADQQWQILYARGVALERSGDWPQAEALLQKALVLQPDQPQILNYLGYSWIDRGEHLTQALELIGKAVAAKPDDGYIVDSLGWAYFRLGDYANATRFLERAVELKPDDPTINDHLGDAYWRVGRRLEARFQWNHALAFKPADEDAKKIAKKLADGLDDPPVSSGPGSRS
jgi:Flp pilus assembly protein TadD